MWKSRGRCPGGAGGRSGTPPAVRRPRRHGSKVPQLTTPTCGAGVDPGLRARGAPASEPGGPRRPALGVPAPGTPRVGPPPPHLNEAVPPLQEQRPPGLPWGRQSGGGVGRCQDPPDPPPQHPPIAPTHLCRWRPRGGPRSPAPSRGTDRSPPPPAPLRRRASPAASPPKRRRPTAGGGGQAWVTPRHAGVPPRTPGSPPQAHIPTCLGPQGWGDVWDGAGTPRHLASPPNSWVPPGHPGPPPNAEVPHEPRGPPQMWGPRQTPWSTPNSGVPPRLPGLPEPLGPPQMPGSPTKCLGPPQTPGSP